MGLLGGTWAAGPRVGVAQVSTRRALVAVLSGVSFGSDTVAAVFAQRLQELGSAAGREIDIVYRYAGGDLARRRSPRSWSGSNQTYWWLATLPRRSR
jgi:hypothetical protein